MKPVFHQGWMNRTQVVASNTVFTPEKALFERLQDHSSVLFILKDDDHREAIFTNVAEQLRFTETYAANTSFNKGYKGMIFDLASQLGNTQIEAIYRDYEEGSWSDLFFFKDVIQSDLLAPTQGQTIFLLINSIPPTDKDFYREMKLIRENNVGMMSRLFFGLGCSSRPDQEYPYFVIEEIA